jgi:subtilase family serine protease
MRIVKYLLPVVVAACLLCTLSFASTPDRIRGGIDPTNVVELTGHVSPLARAQFDQGPVEPSRMMHVTMLLLPTAAQNREMEKLIADQQNRKSPKYHQWLTSDEFGARFGVSQADLDKISAWLKAQGFKVTYVAHGRDYVSFDGNAGQVSNAFRTEIHTFDVNGKMHFANTRAPMIPAALSGIVGGFRGMHDFLPHSMIKHRPNYTITSGSNSFTFLAPGDLATIYDINPLYQATPKIDGTGQKIVIAGQTDIYLADLNDFRTNFGLSPITGCTKNSNGVITACDSSNFQLVYACTPVSDCIPGVQADVVEADLDIQWSGAVARGAKIIFVNSTSVDTSASYAIDNQLAPIISYSYGLCEAFSYAPPIATAELEYKKANTEGITFFAASGDSGAAECDGDLGTFPAQLGLSVSYPASSAYVTAVGGTELNEGSGSYWNTGNGTDGGSAKTYIPEIAWNDTTEVVQAGGSFAATGGGPSNCVNGGNTTVQGYSFRVCNSPGGGFPKPTWQVGVTPADSARDVPDISFSGANENDPYIVCTPQSTGPNTVVSSCANGINDSIETYNSLFGGTSASTPVAAGMAALLNQYLGTNGLGNINQQLYTVLYPDPTVFHDILAGSNPNDQGTSDNIVPCTGGDPTFEPAALRCPGAAGVTGSFGYSAGTGYDTVTGLGSLDINNFILAWAASEISFTTSALPLSPATITAGNSTTSTVSIAPLNAASSSATYTFACSGLPTGATCSFNPTSVTGNGTTVPTTTLTISTLASAAAGTTPVTVTATSGGISSSASPLSLVVTATDQSFTLAPQNPSYQVLQGQAVDATVILTPANGFNTPVTYSCVNPASESLCRGPSGPTANTSVSFHITTTLATGKLQRPRDRGSRIFYAALLPGLLGIVFTLGSRKRSLRGMRLLGLIMVLGFSTLWMGSCGGNSGGGTTTKDPGTLKQTYTITINATTGGASPITGTTTFTLQVQ